MKMSLYKNTTIDQEKYDIRDLESLLRNNFGDELTVVNYSIDNLVPLGENFRSCMLKVSVQVQRTTDSPFEDLYFVAKTAPKLVLEMTRNVDWTRLFEKEIFMYTNIIPFYEKIELENGFLENETIGNVFPKLCGYRMPLNLENENVDKDAVILLENLKSQGYYVMNKKIGLDLSHSIKAIRSLARFHVLGIAAKTKHPDLFAPIKSAYSKPDYDHHAVDAACARFVDAIKTDPRFRKYTARVEKIAEERKGGWKSELVTHAQWSTIVHYDFWTNNMMFHGDEDGNVDGVKFLDFQTYCFADIFLDLVYFIFTSLSDDVKLNRLDDLLDVYYVTFILTLGRLHVDVRDYTRQKFDDGIRRVAAYEFLHCALVLNIITADVVNSDRENLMESIMTFQGNELYFQEIMQLMQIYEERDWFVRCKEDENS